MASHEAGKRSILFKSLAKELRMEESTLLNNNNFVLPGVKMNMFMLVPHAGDLDQDLCGMLKTPIQALLLLIISLQARVFDFLFP